VKLNGNIIWRKSWCGSYPDARGVTVIKIEPITCTRISENRFDTHSSHSNANNLKNHLNGLADGTVVIGVTGREPTWRLSNAHGALNNFGVNVNDVGYRGSFAFVGEKGNSTKTKMDKATSSGQSNNNPGQVEVTIRGKRKVAYMRQQQHAQHGVNIITPT